MNPLVRKAILKADEVREQLELDMYAPINIIDACIDLGLAVRFVNVSMEGLYVKPKSSKRPTILLSNQRPLPRRFYTCAHELGHHVFGHGFKIDGLSDSSSIGSNDSDEFLVDSFAGALLMPIAGIQEAFGNRDLHINNASPIDFYKICSDFGIGYRTLVTHCKVNKLIDEFKADSLNKFTPKRIFQNILGADSTLAHFKIIDEHSQSNVIDLEVSNYIILPNDMQIEGSHLKEFIRTDYGTAFLALKPGIIHVLNSNATKGHFVRIQNNQYEGLAKFRHLETE